LLILVAVYIALLLSGWVAGFWLKDVAAIELRPINEPMIHRMVMTAAGLFIVASATPFVPGVEIGLGLLAVFGASIAFLVYVCMVTALVFAYLVGRLVPITALVVLFAYCGLDRAHDLVMRMAPLDAAGRFALLVGSAPNRVIPFLLRNRHVALIVLFNLPGNAIVGGGGGIALTAGMSGLYQLPAYVACVLIAVAPVPLAFVLGRDLW
jgi:hypothetical protein